MKARIFIFATVFLLAFNLAIPTTVLSENGRPKPKEWKGKGTKIEFCTNLSKRPCAYAQQFIPYKRESDISHCY